MRNDRLDEEDLLANGPVGGERLSKSERQTLRRESGGTETADGSGQRGADSGVSEKSRRNRCTSSIGLLFFRVQVRIQIGEPLLDAAVCRVDLQQAADYPPYLR